MGYPIVHAASLPAAPGSQPCSERRMKAWGVAVCAGVVTLAACSGPHRGPSHAAAMPQAGRHTAVLEVVSGATTLSVGTGNLGGSLLRAWTPASSGIRPVLTERGPMVLLHLESAGHGGPAAVHVLLNPHVTWRLVFAGGTSRTTVSLGQGRVSSVDFAAGTSVIQMTLPRPGGTTPVVLAGGASQATLRLPAGVPARLRLTGGAAFATLAGHTYTGVPGGTVLAAAGWAQAASRYDIDAPAGVSAISVTS